MKNLGVVLVFICISNVFSASKISLARSYFVSSSSPSFVLNTYLNKAINTADPAFRAEYGYVLSCLGLNELGLYQLDRALIDGYAKSENKYYLAETLKLYGFNNIENDIKSKTPKWLDKNIAISCAKPQQRIVYNDEEEFHLQMHELMANKRYIEAISNFWAYCPKENDWPKNWSRWRCWAGFTIALERSALYGLAQETLKKDIEFSDDETHKNLAKEYLNTLKSKQEDLNEKKNIFKGRKLLNINGGYSRYLSRSSYNLNLNIGKFISESFDINGGINYYYAGKSVIGVNTGIRYGYKIKESPIRLSIGGKISKYEGSDFFMVFSPGIGYFIGPGSLDIFYDKSLIGETNINTISAGYTFYF